MKNNELLHFLGKGSSVGLLPQSASDISVCSNLSVGYHSRMNSSYELCSHKDYDSNMPHGINRGKDILSVKRKVVSLSERNRFSTVDRCHNPLGANALRTSTIHGDKLSEQRLFSCVKCGILCFDCVAVIQPREATSRYLMSADCSLLNDYAIGSGVGINILDITNNDANTSEQSYPAGFAERNVFVAPYGMPAHCANYQVHMVDDRIEGTSNSQTQNNSSALGLLATTYGNSSDSEEDDFETDRSHLSGENRPLESKHEFHNSILPSFEQESNGNSDHTLSHSMSGHGDEVPINSIERDVECLDRPMNIMGRSNETVKIASIETNAFWCNPMPISSIAPPFSPIHGPERTNLSRSGLPLEHTDASCPQGSDEDSSRMHVFCLEHAVEVETQLRQIGGVHVLLFCHPDYPRIEAEAKLASEELGIDHLWSDLTFRDATKDDEERIHLALDGEEASPGIADWAVKLGINLFYSVNLGWSPLYSKQMPYNSVMYHAFGRISPGSSPPKLNVNGSRPGRQKKVVAGKWCGKVWMSNQVHHLLIEQDSTDQDQEQEQERSFRGGQVPDEAHEREAQSTLKRRAASVTRKSGKKRKNTAQICLVEKVKALENEDVASLDLAEENSQKQCIKIYSRRKTKAIEKKVSCDSLDDNSLQQVTGNHTIKQADSTEKEDTPGAASHLHFSRVRENRQSTSSEGNSSQKRHGRLSRIKQAKRNGREDTASDGSLGGAIRHWGNLRKKQEKLVEREKTTVCKYINDEDDVSDDSLANSHSKLAWRISQDNQASHSDTEDAVSDYSREESNGSLRSLRSKQGKFFAREDGFSDDSPDESAHTQRKRVLRNKKPTSFGSDDAMSDYLLGGSHHRKNRRIPKSEGDEFIQSDDAESDDFLGNYTNQRLMRTSRSKKANFMERDDESENIQEIKTRRNPRKTPISKAKSIKGPLRQVTPRQMHRENPNLIKQQRQVKQETPRVRNLKNGKAWLFDSHVEEDPEDGRSTRLRKRPEKLSRLLEAKTTEKRPAAKKKVKKVKTKEEEAEYQCDIEGCTMSFGSKQEIALHKKNICPVEGCGKKFFSHKYLVQHRRVHLDDRPLKCPWKGCRMTFKWAWARTEHIRVHTGERPYECAEKGCGQTFRFVSDFSRHKRKTGHSVRKGKK